MDPVFVKGVLAFIIAMAVFVGSVWLLLAMILGVRMGYFVMGTCFFGVMAVIAVLWVFISLVPAPSLGFGVALGPKGRETTWEPVAAGADLQTFDSEFGSFDVADYPGGDWEEPKRGRRIADLGTGIPRPGKADEDTAKESEGVKPVVDSFISNVLSPIPGKREDVQSKVLSEVGLESGKVTFTDIRMKEETVAGKSSVIAVGRVVPSSPVAAGDLGGVEEGIVKEYTVPTGTVVSAGDTLIIAETEGGDVEVASTLGGRVIAFGLRKGDAIKPGVPFAIIDLTGQAGQPEPVEVAAVRVRGSLRTPSFYYLTALSVLFFLHLYGLGRMERTRKMPVAQPA